MPYIPKEQRTEAVRQTPLTAGELNYAITSLLEQYRASHGDSYQTFNDLMGALEGAKLELYRKVVSVYEDRKECVNGPIYKLV